MKYQAFLSKKSLSSFTSFFIFLSTILFSNMVFAVQCPKVAPPSVTFLHQVVLNAQPQPWQMNTTFVSQGWSIVSNPLAENSRLTSVSTSTPLTVIYTRTNTASPNAYQVVCQYQIESGPNPISLTVTNSQAYASPINSNFKKVNETSYICNTDAFHTENCSDADIHPVVCGMGQSC